MIAVLDIYVKLLGPVPPLRHVESPRQPSGSFAPPCRFIIAGPAFRKRDIGRETSAESYAPIRRQHHPCYLDPGLSAVRLALVAGRAGGRAAGRRPLLSPGSPEDLGARRGGGGSAVGGPGG